MYNGKKFFLMILDGWGHGTKPEASAIEQANTPFTDSLYEKYPKSELKTDGEVVGLPQGQMGNSEVGHLNIGAGKIVFQDLVKINNAVKDGSLEKNQKLSSVFNYAKSNNKPVHLIGLVSDGGVHSSQEHLHALCHYAKKYNLDKVFVHAFTDGRDTSPNGGIKYIHSLEEILKKTNFKLASIIGRYYAMDRDKRWERTKLAYDLLVHGKGAEFIDSADAIANSYNNNITDEFIKPVVIVNKNKIPVAAIKSDDVVVCFNYRPDRMRQITRVLTQEDFSQYEMKKLNLHYLTMTEYDSSFKNINILFEDDNLINTLGEIISKEGLNQIRIAETEKYPHVTYFFSGGREQPFKNETRILYPSPKVATYDLKPEMSACEITESIISELNKKEAHFICLNFANADMVGHTGVFQAVVKAVETVDKCVQKVVKAGLENGYSFIIIADHGNADYMINEDGTPHTAHTTNLVPCFLIDKNYKGKLKNGKLADIAPTILKLMNIKIPKEMTGNILIDL